MGTKERTEEMAVRCLVYTYAAIKNYSEAMAEVTAAIRCQFTEEEISQTPLWQKLLDAQAKVKSLEDMLDKAFHEQTRPSEDVTVAEAAATRRIYQSSINSKG